MQKEIRGKVTVTFPFSLLWLRHALLDTHVAEALGWGESLLTPPCQENERASNVFVCMLIPLRTILLATRGVLWKLKRNSLKILWRVFYGVVGGLYGPSGRPTYYLI